MSRMIEVGSKRSSWLGQILSNFAFSPFKFDRNSYASTEGFWQGLKWPPGWTERNECFGLWGLMAKRLGARAPKSDTFLFGGKEYDVGSPEHLDLMKRAIRAKITQNERLLTEFLATGDMEFTHPVPEKRATKLPAKVFCQMLVDIREELRQERNDG